MEIKMAFIYEKIREEDKEWVDFGRFKGLWHPQSGSYHFSSWTVDKERKMALVSIQSIGRLGEDAYVTEAKGFFYQGAYINFTVLYDEIDDTSSNEPIARWYNASFSFPLEVSEQENQIKELIREAMTVYAQRGWLAGSKHILEF
jgi:hypothetical protein